MTPEPCIACAVISRGAIERGDAPFLCVLSVCCIHRNKQCLEPGLRLLAHEEEPGEWGPKAHVQSAALPKKALYWPSRVGESIQSPSAKGRDEKTRRTTEDRLLPSGNAQPLGDVPLCARDGGMSASGRWVPRDGSSSGHAEQSAVSGGRGSTAVVACHVQRAAWALKVAR